MFINSHSAIFTSKVLLVPYLAQHVPRYHTWMQDPDIQAATASEPLTLHEEYQMQKSWRTDGDKLTFIVYQPTCRERLEQTRDVVKLGTDGMIGDVNLFISLEDADEDVEKGGYSHVIVGELELMIADKASQRKGFGRSALLAFLLYILKNETGIVKEFQSSLRAEGRNVLAKFDYFRVKIGKDNQRSIMLFESVGFLKTEEAANYFGEFELRDHGLDVKEVERLMNEKDIQGWQEVELEGDEVQ